MNGSTRILAFRTEVHQSTRRFARLLFSLIAIWALIGGAGRADAQTSTVAFTQSAYTVIGGGGSVVIPVVYSTSVTISSITASVTAFTSNGTATAGVDYLPFSGDLDFTAISPDGSLVSVTNTFTITLLNNPAAASNATVLLELTSPTNTTLVTPSTAILTIFNTNITESVVQFSQAAYSVDDTDSVAVITVTLTGASGAAAVNYMTSDGSAMAGVDYTATTGTLTFAAGVSTNQFTIPLLPPGPLETNKTINLTLLNPGTNTMLGPQTTAVLTIVPTAPPVIQLSAPTYNVLEHRGPAVITAVRFGNTTTNCSVNYATSDGTAVSGRDYLGTSGTLNYGNGDTAKSFSVYLTEYKTFQSNKTFNVTLSNATGGGASLGTQTTAVVTIVNDRPQIITFTNAANGNIVTLTLKSAGAMVLEQDDPIRLALSATDDSSTLKITVKSHNKTTRLQDIDEITSDGGARLIDARFSDLTGAGITLGGYLGQLKIHNIYSNATVTALGDDSEKTSISAFNIDQATINLGSRLGQLIAARFGDGTITVSSLGSVAIKGKKNQDIPGDFQAAVTLTATAAETNGSNLGSIVVSGTISNSLITVPIGQAGSIKAGIMIDSAIYVGYTPTNPLLPFTGGQFTSTDQLNHVSVSSKTNGFSNSFIIAPSIGSVNLASVVTDNGGVSFGVLSSQTIGSVTVKLPPFKWNNAGSSDQSLGDFHVIY